MQPTVTRLYHLQNAEGKPLVRGDSVNHLLPSDQRWLPTKAERIHQGKLYYRRGFVYWKRDPMDGMREKTYITWPFRNAIRVGDLRPEDRDPWRTPEEIMADLFARLKAQSSLDPTPRSPER